jgi:alpha-beta hydrolase superfamily lysophospholipase
VKRKTAVRVGVAVAVLVVLGFIGRAEMLKMRARFEGRHPGLDVMKERPSDVALKYESFDATNPEGTRLAGWWLPAQSPTGSIVMVHGFGQNKGAMLGRAAILVGAGFNVALIDLRARGESGGDRADIEPGAAYDVLAAADALRASRRHTDLPFVAYGFSHGARAVLFAVVQAPQQFAAIIAEAPPFSLREGLRRQTGLPWVPALPEGDLPGTFAALRDRPILLLFGDADPEISDAQARSLLAGNRHAASRIQAFANTGHGVFRSQTREEYRNTVAGFLARALIRREAH